MKDNTGDSSTGRAFQKLLGLSVGSETADSEAVKTAMPVILLNRSQHEDVGGQKSRRSGLPWEMLLHAGKPPLLLVWAAVWPLPTPWPPKRRPGLAV